LMVDSLALRLTREQELKRTTPEGGNE